MARVAIGTRWRTALLDVVACGLAAGATVAWHARWLAADASLPVGDAAGHLVNVTRHLDYLRGGAFPTEPFPPGVYLVSAFLVDRLGPTLDTAVGGTVLFAGLLAGVLAWLGRRAAGWTAAVVLPLVALATPLLSAAARELLLDLPATALIVAVWATAWASEGCRRTVPTLLLGLALGAGALVKYTLFPWVVPALLLVGLRMVLRSPVALLPLVLAALPALHVAEALGARALAPLGSRADPAVLAGLRLELALGAAGACALLLAGTALRRRGRDPSALRGVEDGARLALAALIAVAVVLPWFLHAMPIVWQKVEREAVTEVRAAGLGVGSAFARAMVLRSWPHTWLLLQAAAGIELAWVAAVGWRAWRGWRARSGGGGAEPPRNAPPEPVGAGSDAAAVRLGPTSGILLSCAFGTWFTARSLPVDVRYYLPLLAGVGVALGLAACRFRLGRWVLGPAFGALLAWQLAAEAGRGVATPARLPLAGFSAAAAMRLPAGGPFAAAAPARAPLAEALSGLVEAIVVHDEARGCGSVLLAVPGAGEARREGFEGRSLGAVATLRGLRECAVTEVEVGGSAAGAREARWLATAGVRREDEVAVRAAAPWSLGEPVYAASVGGRTVSLRPLGAARASEAAP